MTTGESGQRTRGLVDHDTSGTIGNRAGDLAAQARPEFRAQSSGHERAHRCALGRVGDPGCASGAFGCLGNDATEAGL